MAGINHELTDEDLIVNLIDTWVEGFKEKNLDKGWSFWLVNYEKFQKLP